MDTSEEFVNVSVRIRPLVDKHSSPCVKVISNFPAVLLHVERQQTYHFDNIFTDDSEQENVFHDTVKSLIEKVKEGFNCTVFAYGQTGTGKTYTMGTSSQKFKNQDVGLIPRTLTEFFTDGNDNSDLDISVSFIEIYNEKVYDLLGDLNTALPVSGFKVQGVKHESIYSSNEGIHYLEIGGKNRHTGETKQNIGSSRSHAIFTIYCTLTHSDGCKISSKLNLVDLAGCESVKKTGNQGSTFHEGVNINKGLLCIGQVMTALSHNGLFIPYRQSVITSILQDSLNRKNYVTLIACISSNADDSNETAQTLEFSQRVKKMKTKPEVNNIVLKFKEKNPLLFERASFTPSVKTGLTPFKRSNSNIFQTPFANKKQKLAPTLSSIQEPSASIIGSTLDSPKSLFSMSLSSISNMDSVQQSLSPMLKKYMTAMENSLMDKLQTVIENTVKRIPVRSPRINKENTPSLSWNTVQSEVSRLVRTEISQLTARVTRATSSPIEKYSLPTKRVLRYDESPQQIDEPSPVTEDVANNVFKMPKVPSGKRKNQDDILYGPTKRRSIRLIKKYNRSPNKHFSNISCHDEEEYANTQENILNKNSSYKSFEDTMWRMYADSPLRIHKVTTVTDDVFKVPGVPSLEKYSKKSVENTFHRIKNSNTSLDQSYSNISCEDDLGSTPLEAATLKNNSYKHQECLSTDIIKQNKSSVNEKVDHVFKVPDLLPRHHVTSKEQSISPKKKRGRTLSKRVAENNSLPVKRRSSIRLQAKKASPKDRKSLQINNENDNHNMSSIGKRRSNSNSEPKPNLHEQTTNRNVGSLRRSKRLSIIPSKEPSKEYECICISSKGVKPKKPKSQEGLITEQKGVDSPITARTKEVLAILNSGKRRDIEKLHTVGPKTADRILMFRTIKGCFHNISDLSEMPEWRDKRYKAFLSQNFLRDE